MHQQARQFNLTLSSAIAICAVTVIAALVEAENAGAADAAPAEAVILTGRTMGTTYRIKYWGESSATPADVREKVDALLERFDEQMSTYREDSELSRFNSAAAGKWFDVSHETAYVVERAIEYQRTTGGTMDVTVGPVLRSWHFGGGVEKGKDDAKPPSAKQLHEAMKLVGAGRVDARRMPPALWKDVDGVEIDLSAIAPGYAVDLIVELLKSLGFPNAMVEIGGEVCGAGGRPDGTPWRIGVESVDGSEGGEGRGGFAQVVPLTNLALSTAGDYKNFRTADGKRYTHIVDPRSGQALPYRGAAVTVIAETCLASDALDTALLVMGAESGYQWCVKHDVAALFQTRGDDDGVVEQATPRFKELLQGK
ncbi:MAG: FAD:protein FMN transferase [Pirellulales bacterium]|nr:FAD:protein FMN transferase [Pirellulales bacterium]